jgi:hypothetical protein
VNTEVTSQRKSTCFIINDGQQRAEDIHVLFWSITKVLVKTVWVTVVKPVWVQQLETSFWVRIFYAL